MKINLFLFIFLLLSCGTKNSEGQLNSDCELLAFVNERASCGIFSVWVGMKFRAIKKDLTFVGLVNCPFDYVSTDPGFYKVGNIYKVAAQRPFKISQSDLIINEFDSTGLPVYRVDELVKK